ncbi:MAG: tRNA-dependent cyclodipeptide synthase [Candidatus Paceibacterota bacterium]|jgi:tRNA-dependent cyclodipeptide synthase
MEIKNCLLVSKESIMAKEHNLWIGYSCGNKWFTLDSLSELIELGLKHTKKSLLILIQGRLGATNFKYIENMGRAEALKEAFRVSDEKRVEIENLVKDLPEDRRSKIIIADYDEVLTPQFITQREILMREFSLQKEFYDRVMEISEDFLDIRHRTISKNRKEDVALYILQELPLFLDGVIKKGTENLHTVILYPGLGKLDYLVKDILEDNGFKSLKERLVVTNNPGIADIQ